MPSETQSRNWRHGLVQTEWKQQPLFISSHRNPKHLRRKHQTRGRMRFHLQKLSPILDPFHIKTTTCNKRSLQRSLSKVFTCFYKVLTSKTKTGDFIFSDYGLRITSTLNSEPCQISRSWWLWKHRGTQRGYSSKPLNIALLAYFSI